MALSLRVAARAWIFKLYRVVFLYSGFLVYLFEVFSSRPSGVARHASHFSLLVQRKVTKRKHTI